MIANGAEQPRLRISKGYFAGQPADVQFGVVITVRIAAIDEHMVSTETPHVGQPHGLIVEYEVRDRPMQNRHDRFQRWFRWQFKYLQSRRRKPNTRSSSTIISIT